MQKLAYVSTGVLVAGIMIAGMAAPPAMSQERAKEAKAAKHDEKAAGKATTKVLVENNRIRVTETAYKPGDEDTSSERPYRVTRALQGGTMERIYADGKKERGEWKTGQVKADDPDRAYKARNVGHSEIVLYTVNIKQVK